VGLLFPALRADNEALLMAGSYLSSYVQAALLFDGKIRITFDVVNVSFRPQWANPLWATLAFPEELERGQVMAALQGIVAAMPVRAVEWDQGIEVSTSLNHWLLLQGRSERLLRWAAVQLLVFGSILGIHDRWGCGTLCTIILLAVGNQVFLFKQVVIYSYLSWQHANHLFTLAQLRMQRFKLEHAPTYGWTFIASHDD
jgi:hypothetical protein